MTPSAPDNTQSAGLSALCAPPPDGNRRVIVGLSGGVDSSVAAALLLERGWEVIGAALRLWHATAAPSFDDAAAVAAALGIPFRVLDVREQFYHTVVVPFAAEYARGRTPNPCVFCNPGLKFAALLSEAERRDAAWIASGHYARIIRAADGTAHLHRARSLRQDQAYMLYRLTQRHLRRLLLPLGELPDKATVRQLARRFRLPGAARRDSQDLCFVNGDYRPLLRQLHPQSVRPGPILDEDGHVLGTHRGLSAYTVGQRSGLRISAPQRLYVLRLLPEQNALLVGPAERLWQRQCSLESVTFTVAPPESPFRAQTRVRYHAPLAPSTVRLLPEARAEVTFDEPQRGPAPGQSLVWYRGDEVLGGGVITASRAA